MSNPNDASGPVRYLKAPPLELDISEQRLVVDGALSHVGAKAFRLLRALMERPEQLLTKDQLIETVWEGRSVSDAVLTTAMKELRKALDDPARSPRFIETVHGRGYRFLLPVEAVGGPASKAANETKRVEGAARPSLGAGDEAPFGWPVSSVLGWWIAAGLVLVFSVVLYSTLLRDDTPADQAPVVETAASADPQATVAVPHPKSIAVTPFADLSEDAGQAWFANGLTDEISSTLAQTPDLRVMFGPAPGAGSGALKVAHVLEGSVRRSADRVRVTARLYRARDGQSIWSETYDRANADMISIQEDIAFKIAQALRTVTDPEQLAMMVETGTRSVEAYEALLAGHHYLRQQYITGEPGFRRRSYEEYERARALDPNFAEAHWLASRYWFERSTYIFPPGEESLRSTQQVSEWFEERVNAAIEAASDETALQLYRAALYSHRLEYRTAHRLLRDYVERRPRDHYGWVMRLRVAAYVGDYETGRAAAHELASLADETSLYFSRTIPNLMWVWDFESAERQAMRSLLLAPENAFVQYHSHRALLWMGKMEEARKLLPQIQAGDLAPNNKKLASLRQACAEGDAVAAEAVADEVRRLEPASVASRWLAEMLMGRADAANEVLAPYDRQGNLHQLAPFMIYPHFDSRAFPLLTAELTAENIERPEPLALPYACRSP